MQEHRDAVAVQQVEDRCELRKVERRAGRVRVDLHARCAQVAHGALDLLHGGGGVAHRHGGEKAGEPVRVPIHELGEAVIAGARQLRRGLRTDECLDGGRAERDDLPVVGERVHQAEACVEVAERWQLHRAAEHALVRSAPLEQFEKPRRHEVRERVDRRHGRHPPRNGAVLECVSTRFQWIAPLELREP
jgi:hypothetical protein